MPSLFSTIATMDRHCLLAAGLFVLSDIIITIGSIVSIANRKQFFTLDKLYDLDPTFIETEYEWITKYTNVNLTFEIINSLAWFVLCIPIIKVAWIQSNYGTRQMGMNITIVVLALGGSFSELLARLLALGSNNALSWMASKFNLNDWNVMDTTGNDSNTTDTMDRIGWRTLEMIDIAMSGLLLWIDAIEYLFLSGILILLAFSIRADNELFVTKWAKFGAVMAVLGIVEFAVSILRFENWNLFSFIGGIINILNQLILFPVWLIWLGRQLPKAEAARNSQKQQQQSDNRNNGATENSDNSMLT